MYPHSIHLCSMVYVYIYIYTPLYPTISPSPSTNKYTLACINKSFTVLVFTYCFYVYMHISINDEKTAEYSMQCPHSIIIYQIQKKNNSFLELPSATSINSVLNEENEEHRFGIKGYPAVFICLPWKLLFSSTKQLDIRHLKYIYI